MKRRYFLNQVAAAGVLSQFPLITGCESGKGERLKILILGGTSFVGPAIVNEAVSHGHQVTLFNRGITNPSLFPDLPLIKGDRESGRKDYQSLLNQNWDVVIDVWPEKSRLVDDATNALKENTGHYIFISSIAVYSEFQTIGLNEESPTLSLPEDQNNWYYGEEKVMSERLIKERFPNNHTIIRGGPITGWRNPAVDLLYWTLRLQNQSTVLAPGSGNDPIQFIDVKDVAKLAISTAEQKHIGIFNCLGPMEVLLWRDFLEEIRQTVNPNCELVWASEEFLKAQNVYSFSDMPLWAPLSEDPGFMQISNEKLKTIGFKYTPITETIKDDLGWYKADGSKVINFGSESLGQGLTREREEALLDALMPYKSQA